jgi:bifunctional DNA-binding transcriptional regulator/antitoxin component of YhaV-PrlF toxin-antitoxin module
LQNPLSFPLERSLGGFFLARGLVSGPTKFNTRPMTYTSTVTQDGHTTLPEGLRQSLKIRPGDTLEYEITEQGAQIRVRHLSLEAVLDKYQGLFGSSEATTPEAALAESRALRGRSDDEQETLDRWDI